MGKRIRKILTAGLVALLAAILLCVPVLASGTGKTIQSITIFGARQTPAETILHHLGVQVGEEYDPFKLGLGITWLRNNGMFAEVDYEVLEQEDLVKINLFLNEQTGSAKTGGNTVFGAVKREERYGWFEMTLPFPSRLLGWNFDAGIGLNISKESFMLAPGLSGLELFGAPLGWFVEARYITKADEKDTIGPDPEWTIGGTIGLKQALLPDVSWMVLLGYEYERKVGAGTGNHYMFLTDRFTFDVHPLKAEVETELGYAAGDDDNGFYFKFGGRAELPVAISDEVFLLNSFQLGWASPNTPYRALFDVSPRGMRGYTLDEADRYFIGSTGLYWQVIESVQLYTFCDIGSIRYPAGNWSELLATVGIGARVNMSGIYVTYNGLGQFKFGLSFDTYF